MKNVKYVVIVRRGCYNPSNNINPYREYIAVLGRCQVLNEIKVNFFID